MTPREKRKRQKRPRADVRKVHRFGFSRRNAYGKGPKVNGPRNRLRAACGKLVTDIERHHNGVPYAVPDDAFISLPKTVQCDPCRWAGWPSTTFVPLHKRSGTHEHLMAVELLVATMQRLWQARLEVGHRCYVALFMHDSGVPAAYRRCSCGRFSYVDEATRSHTMAVLAGKREPLIVQVPTLISMLATQLAADRARSKP